MAKLQSFKRSRKIQKKIKTMINLSYIIANTRKHGRWKKSLNFTVLSTTTVLIFLIHLQGKNINLWRSLIAGSCLMIHPLHQPLRGHGCSHQQFTVQSLSMLCIQGLHRLIGPQQNMATMVQPWRRHLDKGRPSSSLFFKPKVSCRALNTDCTITPSTTFPK